jgi:hypothetical protein
MLLADGHDWPLSRHETKLKTENKDREVAQLAMLLVNKPDMTPGTIRNVSY